MTALDRVGIHRISRLCLALAASLSVACDDDGGDSPASMCEADPLHCTCSEEEPCPKGFTCEQSECVAENATGIIIGSADARACEVLLLEDSARVSGVDFSENVRGTFLRQAPRIAVSLTRRMDSSFEAADLTVRSVGSNGGLSLAHAECFGERGVALKDARVYLESQP